MTNRLALLLLAPLALAAMIGTAVAQDAKTVLQAADRAMGASGVNSIQYAGTGWMTTVGQSYAADSDWPRADLKSYSNLIDYPSRSGKEEYVRVQGNNPPLGGGFQPLIGDVRSLNLVAGNFAWTLNAQGQPNAQSAAAEQRQFTLWTSPHGFIKAAEQAADVAVADQLDARTGQARKTLRFTMGKYRLIGEFDEGNLLTRLVTWIPSPMMGDMQVEFRYSDYRDIGGGVKFPFRIHANQGDHPLIGARNWLDLAVSEAKANVPGAAQAVPANVRGAAAPPPAQANSRALGNGVWLIGGAGANSIAVEFRDFITVVEAPDSETRSNAVIAEVKRIIPGKPIRYLVNTHHHWDHTGGIRTFAAEGATIVTHDSNRNFYEKVVLAPQPRTLGPDRLSLAPLAAAKLETFADNYAISDGTQTMMIYHVAGLDHALDMGIVYIPSAKILISADMGPPAPGTPASAIDASAVALYNLSKRLKLDVVQHLPIHGAPSTQADFKRTVGPVAAARASGNE